MPRHARAAGRAALALVLAAGTPAAAQSPAGPLRILPEKLQTPVGPTRLAVKVSDESGRPVAGAMVVFTFPSGGPSAFFASGLRSEIVTADSDGRAAVAGLHWDSGPGKCLLSIRATYANARAEYEWPLEAGSRPPVKQQAYRSPGGGAKWLWVVLLAGGGAAAGGMAMKNKSPGSSPAASAISLPVVVPTVGQPGITITRP